MNGLLIQALRSPESMRGRGLGPWELLLRQALAANLTPALGQIVQDAGLLEQVPAPARAHLDWAQVQGVRHARAVEWEIRQIQQALGGLDQPLILLKGAAYAAARLPLARGRLFSDIDILLPRACMGAAEGALMLHGWVGMHQDDYDQRYYREWMHELPPMVHLRRDTAIDVHHTILPLTARAHPDADKLRAAAVDVPHLPGVKVLAPVDMVLHSATHLFYDGEFDKGLRDLLDIHRLLQHFGADPAFWTQLAPRAFEMQLARPLYYALRYAARLLGTPVPAALATALRPARPNPALLALMDALFLRALQPMHASCADAWTGAAHQGLYLRGNWLRMPPLMLARHLFHKAFLSPRATPV